MLVACYLVDQHFVTSGASNNLFVLGILYQSIFTILVKCWRNESKSYGAISVIVVVFNLFLNNRLSAIGLSAPLEIGNYVHKVGGHRTTCVHLK